MTDNVQQFPAVPFEMADFPTDGASAMAIGAPVTTVTEMPAAVVVPVKESEPFLTCCGIYCACSAPKMVCC